MKRIKKIVLFLLLIILFTPFTVFADDCSDVMDAVSELELYNMQYTSLDCDNATSDEDIVTCNLIIISRSDVLERIFEYHDAGTCPSIDLSSIIHDYENNCTNRFSTELKVFADSVMKFFYILAPFIIIIFGSLDLFKIITGNNPDETKKNRSNLIKRIIAFLLLYITPFVVNKLFSFTIYDINGPDYICTEEITLEPKITSGTITGIYGGNNYGGDGQAIAEAAKEIKEYIIDNGYSYGFTYLNADKLATSAQTNKIFCCATLVRASLYRAGLFTVEELEFLHNTETAGLTAEYLSKNGWEIIWDPDELQPGDVIAYNKTSNTCYTTNIDGKYYYVCHVDIYYGDGKKVSTGDGCSYGPDCGFYDSPVLSDFVVHKATATSQGFLCAFRYTGKK